MKSDTGPVVPSESAPSEGAASRSFGDVLKEKRTRKGLTLERLAKQVGVGKGYLSALERGNANPPSPKVTGALAKVLGVSARPLLVLGWAEKAPRSVRRDVRLAVAHLVPN